MIGEQKVLWRRSSQQFPSWRSPPSPSLWFDLSMNISHLICCFFSLSFSAWTSAGLKIFRKSLPKDGGKFNVQLLNPVGFSERKTPGFKMMWKYWCRTLILRKCNCLTFINRLPCTEYWWQFKLSLDGFSSFWSYTVLHSVTRCTLAWKMFLIHKYSFNVLPWSVLHTFCSGECIL